DLGNQVSAKGFGWGSNSAGLVSIHSKESNGYILKVSNTIDFSYQDISDNEITEIGLRNGGATGTLVTRALIKDQSGNPASIQIAEGQTLRLTYSLYVFLPFIITEGVASTPFGDLHYRIGMPDYIINTATEIAYWDRFYMLRSKYVATPYPWTGSSNPASDPAHPRQTVFDTPNRTVTITSSFQAAGADRPLGANASFPSHEAWRSNLLFGEAAREVYGGVRWTGTRLTLPAYYNFVLSWEVTWGRLP